MKPFTLLFAAHTTFSTFNIYLIFLFPEIRAALLVRVGLSSSSSSRSMIQ